MMLENDPVARAILRVMDTVSADRIRRLRKPGYNSRNVTVSVGARAMNELLDVLDARYPGIVDDYIEIAKRVELESKK